MFLKNSTTRVRLAASNRAGFSVMELSVIIAILVLIMVVTVSYSIQAGEKRRDTHRRTELNKFAQQLEEYKNAHGVYPCGDSCVGTTPDNSFTFDCSDVVGGFSGPEPDERNGFLNGGTCCSATSDFYSPTSTSDDRTWGLYKRGYLSTYTPHDPREGTFGGSPYRYCYATPWKNRAGYLLTARLESSQEGTSDSGLCAGLYEIQGGRYPGNGWKPNDCLKVSGTVRCGDLWINPPEQCDDGNTNNFDSCRNNCMFPRCGDGIVDPGEQCDDGNTSNFDGCNTSCMFSPAPFVCGNGIVEGTEECDDGNTISGDGCSSSCTVESGYIF